MVDNYGSRKLNQQKNSFFKPLLWMLFSFLCGYLTATLFDLTSLSHWISTSLFSPQGVKNESQNLAKQTELAKPKFEFYTLLAKDTRSSTAVSQVDKPSEIALQTTQVAQTTKLTPHTPIEVEINTPQGNTPAEEIHGKREQPHPAVQSSPSWASLQPVSENKLPRVDRESYLVQMASFRSKMDAERMKASLILKGFHVSIMEVIQQQVQWYRVIVGPFNSRKEAEQTQVALAKTERILGMVRRMDA